MSCLVNDVNATLKGVKGASDAIRRDDLGAAYKALERGPNQLKAIEETA